MEKTILKIDGMACSMCENHINDIIRREFDIKKVKSSYKKGETVITSENSLDKEKLQKIIADTGYQLITIT